MKQDTFSRLLSVIIAIAILKLALAGLSLLPVFNGPGNVEAASDVNPKAQPADKKALRRDRLEMASSQCSQEFLDLINARAHELDEKEKALMAKQEDLKLLEEEIDKKIKLLKRLQRDLEGPIKKRAADEEARLQHLAGVYASMEPARAAALLNKLDDETVTKLFSIMKSKKVAFILANMEPEKAARISSYLYRNPEM
jgi:flagellar motility protein MotE (MotC chaperone)